MSSKEIMPQVSRNNLDEEKRELKEYALHKPSLSICKLCQQGLAGR